VIVTTTDGLKSEAYIPVSTSSGGTRGWKNVAVPLQALAGFDRTNKIVKEVAFSADATTTFYVGDIRVVNDATPLRAEPNARNLNLALGDEYVFSASGQGGSSILKYTWDFDDKDGVDVDAEGQSVRRKFRKAGTYTITLTVADYFGLKQPYTTTIKAVVNP
jgi:PKD repeat protein